MSRLDDLIQELCPDGVEYKRLKDVASFSNGKGHEKNIANNGKYIVVNSKFISTNGTVKKFSNIQICPLYVDDILMVMSDLPNGKALAKCYLVDEDDKYTLNQRIGCFHTLDENIITTKFLFNILNRNHQLLSYDNGIDQTNLRKDTILNIYIPIPPIPVQQEIIHLLDDFTAKTAELQAELNKEYEARKKQYDCYKDMLIKQSLKQCNVAKLSNIASVYDGTHQTPEYKNEGVPFISVENIDDIYSSNKYITLDAFNKYKIKPQVNDVFMTRIGSIGKCSIMTRQENLAYYVSLALIRLDTSLIDPRYFKHYIESPLGKSELYKRTLHHAVPIKINKDDIGKITIKYPDLNTQKEITSILDNLDSMHNEFILTLKSELESRQKQYEYYRDKLLTFKELNESEVN